MIILPRKRSKATDSEKLSRVLERKIREAKKLPLETVTQEQILENMTEKELETLSKLPAGSYQTAMKMLGIKSREEQ